MYIKYHKTVLKYNNNNLIAGMHSECFTCNLNEYPS